MATTTCDHCGAETEVPLDYWGNPFSREEGPIVCHREACFRWSCPLLPIDWWRLDAGAAREGRIDRE